MDRDLLRNALPSSEQFAGYAPLNKKACAEDFVASILDAIAADGLAPDDWEARDLAAALGMIACRWYHAAIGYADRAMTPPGRRSPIQPVNAGAAPTAADLRNALEYVRGIPAV